MTVPHYGKRNLGAGTAASPGDTLHFNFASYNDSGDSEALSGFAVGDIEVFKDGAATARATDSGYSLISDTGQIGDRVGLYRFRIQLFNTADDASFYANGSWYQVAVDSVSIDGKTVRAWVGSFEIGEPRANVTQIGGDTGAANYLRTTFAAGFSDTGINERLARIQSDVDTGLRTHINDLDTGMHDTLSDYDTGVRGILITTGVNLGRIRGDTGAADRFFRYTQKLDTGGDATVSAAVDTGLVNQAVWQANAQRKLTVDTGIADQVWMQTKASYITDTGTFGEHLGGSLGGSATVDTGVVNQAVWQGNATRSITNVGDTGIVNSLQIIRSDVDTGLRVHIDDLDTGLHAHISDVDTGLHSILQTAGVLVSAVSDTGINQRFAQIQSDVDTGLRTHIDDLDTGLHAHISDVDTGLHDTIADLDTGLRPLLALQDTGAVAAAVWSFSSRSVTNVTAISDTGVNQQLGAIQTKTDGLTFTVAGQVDANIQYVNDTQVAGTGDTGSGDTWRPA